MKYTYLGRTGLKVSQLVLGTMNFGPRTDEAESFAIMDAALEAGIQFFDTANVYGGWDGEGHHGWTEEIMGRWFAQGGGRREKVVLATKVYNVMQDPYLGPNEGLGLSAYKIRRHLEDSLRRLQTDHIELYQMHHIDEVPGWDELYGVFENVVAAGKVVYVGSSNFGARHIVAAQAAADKRHFLGLVSEQHKLSLTCRLPELEVLPACADLGLGVIAWSPLGGGVLSGKAFDPAAGRRTQDEFARLTPTVQEQVKRYYAACAELGESPANVALAWTLSRPAVTGPIIGPRTVAQLEDTLRAVEINLEPDFLALLDDIFPGPGGASPWAYAW
ncbi:MAG: aldo/keto reductase [Bifidobacteriaceae bacterium]|nr:aldo/keto reductase [Bifidobacteriaceae bacterium]